ncbi:MAG: hypothetical protein IMZ60_04720 [Actinobacteria bacterium]|nr:hypothetical protein [Actinomycetota bacterium]
MEKRIKKQEKINELILDELQYGYSCEKRVHEGWIEQKKMQKIYKKKTGFISSLFGKWQYVYKSEKGRISLIRISISDYEKMEKRRWVWEIWSQEKLFPDVRRFKTKKEAEKVIKEYLCPSVTTKKK